MPHESTQYVEIRFADLPVAYLLVSKVNDVVRAAEAVLDTRDAYGEAAQDLAKAIHRYQGFLQEQFGYPAGPT